MAGLIRTVGGDLESDLAGPSYVHEHLIIDTPLVAEAMPHIHLHSVEEARAEVQTCIAVGVRTMVDAMPAASGRDPERLTRISILTGMRVVAATGLHTARYYEGVPWTREETVDQLAQRFIADVEEGIDTHDYLGEVIARSDARAGIVKAGALTEELTGRDKRLFEAVAMTHLATGVPVLTHTEGGHGGLAQIETLMAHGVRASRIALSHTDKVSDLGYHRAMLETGATLCYDQGIRDADMTFGLVTAMVDDGFSGQVVMGTDGARRSLWSTLNGSPGLACLYVTARERLDSAVVDQLFVTNPAHYLSLST